MRNRLTRLRSFIWWTVPLYVLFLLAGLYASGFAFVPEMTVLLAVLIAFAVLDAVVLLRIQSFEQRSLQTIAEVAATHEQIERLARFLILAAIVFGATFGIVFLLIVTL